MSGDAFDVSKSTVPLTERRKQSLLSLHHDAQYSGQILNQRRHCNLSVTRIQENCPYIQQDGLATCMMLGKVSNNRS